ncbi:MAG: signal peptidase I [Oliverpabstia sp.]
MAEKCINGFYSFLLFLGVVGAVLFLLPGIFRIEPRIVMSGSMEPAVSTGSIVYIAKNVKPELIEERDIIAFRVGDRMQVMHRVMKVDKEEKTFITKGDANASADIGPVGYDSYEGKVIGHIPSIGYLVQKLQSRVGMMVMCGCIVLLVLLEQWISLRKKRRHAI